MNSSTPAYSKSGIVENASESPTFKLDMSIKVDAPVGAMSISPCSRDIVLASRQGLHIIDLDNPYDPPRFLQHHTAWSVADVQWSPHASHSQWVVSTSNQKAIVWNLALPSQTAIEHVLNGHTRAITDINFSAHEPNLLATCSIDSFVHCWDLRVPQRPVMSFCDWFAGATQVKYNRQNPHVLASAHDRCVYIWDTRMGAQEIRKITAHSTKIYGIDWNRTRPTGILTCALDKSVKFWDYGSSPDGVPERTIETPFPVWRARHTPFGWGVLTMPQRGDTSLYLWDRRAGRATLDTPVHKFEGHQDHVKEFVWRWRGGERDGNDDRDFQLVTWGLDKDIRLWDVNKDVMTRIGHDPAKKMRFRVTRKGAPYMTYRNEELLAKQFSEKQKELEVGKQPPPKLTLTADGARIRKDGLFLGNKGGLTYGINQQLSQASIQGKGVKNDDDRRFERAMSGAREGGFMRVGRRRQIEINPITWMKGVKIARKVTEGSMDASRTSARGDFSTSWDAPESLGDEIAYVGSKFRNINFEKVNIATRTCTVSLTGPWGADSKRIFVRVDISFPQDYPTDGSSIPEFKLEKTNSISNEIIDTIDFQLRRIALAHVGRRRVCLEPCLCYLLGERADDAAFVGSEDEQDSSSDDEEIVNTNAIGDEEETIDTMQQSSVPLPKTCGSVWAPDGTLLCFFPPKEDRMGKSLLVSLAAREGERAVRAPGGGRLWEGFGRLYTKPPANGHESDDHEGSTDDSSYSSDDTSDGDTDLHHAGPLRPNFGWRMQNRSLSRGMRRGGSTDRSTQRSTGTGVKTTATITAKRKSVVSMYDMSHFLPAKKELATHYIVGEGADVCKHNAQVALKNEYFDLADVWSLVEMVLRDDIPLEIYNSPRNYRLDGRGDSILVMARRANLERCRRDSGLGLELDDDEEYGMLGFDESNFWGRVKWGGHPMGGTWLIDQLFEYFEKKADIQMLAMLSCVLHETDSRGGNHEVSAGIMIPAKKGLSFSDDYFPNIEMVVESQKSNYSISPSHHHHAVALTPIGNSSSYSSSAGGHFGAHFGSDPLVPYSTGTTPPMNSLQLRPEDWPNGPNSLSASPETHHHHNAFRRSTSSNLARFAPANASPPFRKRQSPADGIPPLFATSAVTWGAITTFGSGSKAPSDTATESTADPLEPITITMHHRNQFDDEESIGVRVPLLSPRRSAFYKAYRENYADLLYTWQLQIQRLEVLKFNTTEPESGSPILGPVSSARVQAGTTNGLEIAGHCSKCGSYLDVTTGAKGECNGCKRRQATMTCVVCEVVIKGLYGPCLKCGHVAHSHCHREWFHGDEGEGGRVDRRSCPTGCGCICLGNDDIYLFGSGELTGGRRNVPTVEEPLMSADQWAVAYEGEYLW